MTVDYNDIESVVQQYVTGSLSEYDQEEFEIFFLDKPDIIEMVNLAQKMHIGLSQNNPTPMQNIALNPSWITGIMSKALTPAPAHLVGLLLGMLVIGLPAYHLRENSSPAVTSYPVLAFSTAATRGSDINDPRFKKSDFKLDYVNFFFKLAEINFPRYRVELIDSSTQKMIWQSGEFHAKTFSALRDKSLIVPIKEIEQNFEFQLYGLSESNGWTPVSFCHYSERC